MTMAKPMKGACLKMPVDANELDDEDDDGVNQEKITKYHPFFTWKVGGIIKDVKCVAIDVRDGINYIELMNRDDGKQNTDDSPPLFVEEASRLTVGSEVLGVITSIAKQNKGLWVQICPGINGFIPGLELSEDVEVLNNLGSYYKIGGRVTCCVVEDKSDKGQFKQGVRLSILKVGKKSTKKEKSSKPVRGGILIGRVNRFIKQQRGPSLMIELPGGYLGRCDITELEENDDWDNMPLGRSNVERSTENGKDAGLSEAEKDAEMEAR